MVLGYHADDFSRSGSPFNPSTATLISSQSGISNLFNGNISSWTLQTDTVAGNYSKLMGFKYRYDQLNRIRKENYNQYSGSWSDIDDWDSHYAFDANGNITKLLRNGDSGTDVDRDSLTAFYYNGTNRLRYVRDAVAAGTYATDIDNQSDNNYEFSKIGERVKDVEGGIDTITWTVYGKIAMIVKSNGDTITYTYDAAGNRVSKTVDPASGDSTVTHYVRDASGNIMSMYEQTVNGENYEFRQTSVPIYGSQQLGLFKPGILVKTRPICLPCSGGNGNDECIYYKEKFHIGDVTLMPVDLDNIGSSRYTRLIDKKEYQVNDHLGNVRITLSDKRQNDSTATIAGYTHYHAYGTEMASKTYSNTDYEFGYNSKLKDDEVFGASGTFYDYGERSLDVRGVPGFLSRDRFESKFPNQSSYIYASNSPIFAIDVNGDSTYLVIYGSGWYKPSYKGKRYDVGQGFRKSAEAIAAEIRNRPNFDPSRDQVVIVYAPTEKAFLQAVNKEYTSGKIAELYSYTHGTSNSINFGGEESSSDTDEDERWLSVYDVSGDADVPGEREFEKIDETNFEDNVRVYLYGCNLAGSCEADASTSPAHEFVQVIGGNSRSFALQGGGGAEFKSKGGKAPFTYDGEMIRSADRKQQKSELTKFKP